eukprot:Protomagalhaensia_sp_Gyna_25__4928@NODE_52_length_6070_cov_248_257005_g39_i0_p7_GENE_NODE_52_length_6070_cov_248_257005_g39_i0NODE_52_length_6070_cov_248_257005_g39_i0_p7_ORF_typecomplete_len113_score8_31CPW_WPC/PF09717_10/2_2e07_NODE_52_length_6070_cov_248_257005_g39_i024212759
MAARFPCLRFGFDDCPKDFHSCPLEYDPVQDNGCKARSLRENGNCPDEINLLLMDPNQLEMMSKECDWKFPCKGQTIRGQVSDHSMNSIRRARKKSQIDGYALAPNWSMVFE